MAVSRDVSIRIAVAEAEQAINRLRAIGKEGEEGFQRLARGAGLVPAPAKAAGEAVEGMSRSMRGSLGNVAQQVQDVAVQFQAGTSAAVIFAQQGPQILGAFGPVGAMVGALAGVTAVAASALFGFGKEADKLPTILDDVVKGLNDAEDAASRYSKALLGATEQQRAMIEAVAGQQLGALRERVPGQIDTLLGDLDLRFDVQRSGPSGRGLNAARAGSLSVGDIKAKLRAAILSGDPDAARQILLDANAFATDAGAAAAGRVVELATAMASTEAVASGDAALIARLQEQQKGFAASMGGITGAIGSAAREDLDGQKKADAERLKIVEAARDRELKAWEGYYANLAKVTSDGQTRERNEAAQAAERAKREAEQEAERLKRQAEQAAEAANREAAARGERVRAIQIEAQELARLDAANKVSAGQYRETQIQIEAERAVRSLGAKATQEQTAAIYAATVAAERHKDAIEAQNEALREQERAATAAAKSIDDFYRAAGDRIDSLFGGAAADENRETENLQRNLQSNVADAIRLGFEDGFSSADQLVTQFGSLLTATIASSVADTVISDGLTTSIKKALGGSLGDLAPSLAQTSLGSTSVMGLLGAGAFGAVGGSLFGSLTGRNSTATGIGGGLGAAAGFAFGGPWGAALGGLGGSLLGGFFGGDGSAERNNDYQAGFNLGTNQALTLQNTRPDQANVSAATALAQQLQAAAQALHQQFGATLGTGDLIVRSGNRSGLELNGVSYGSAQELTLAGLRQIIDGSTGLSDAQRLVAQRSTATDAQGLLSDLSIPEQLDQLRRPMTAFSTALKEQTRIYAEANDNAERLGLSTKGLAEAEARDRQKLVDAYKAELGILTPLQVQVANQIEQWGQAKRQLEELGLTEAEYREARTDALRATREAALAQLGFIDPLTQQVNAIRQAFEDAAKSAEFLGKSEAELAAQRDKLIREAVDRQREQLAGQAANVFSFLPGLQSFQSDIAINGVGGGTQLDQFRALRAEYERVRRRAETGDSEALGQIGGLGQQLLNAGQGVYASSPAFADLRDRVTGDINSLADTFGQLQKDNFAALMEDNRANVYRQTEALVAELRELKKAIDKAGFGNAYRAKAA